MIAPVQNQLSKSMLTHIGIALTLGGGAAFTFWNKIAMAGRADREAYYVKIRAERA
ncbi:hypothetical protein BGX23_007480 [Mortierella sp. AD031]|nr:hypothetical protein BGX23_007480 [Mortierella sp. AD031]KAG0219782.1 hypothetical protein BGX33_000624 [Mortierella sp. NVP41]